MFQNSSRRSFVKMALGLTGLALLAPNVFAEEKRRGAAPATTPTPAAAAGGGDTNLPLVKPGEGMAASLHYQYKNTDVKDAAMKVERSGVPFAQQSCSRCMLYTKAGMKNGEEVGKCSLFAGQLVKGTGWCQSWTKKA